MKNSLRSSVLFITSITPDQALALKGLEETLGRTIRPILLRDHEAIEAAGADETLGLVQLIIDFNDPEALKRALVPYKDDILTVTCKDDESAAYLKQIVPLLPDIILPLPESLEWSTEKTKMRPRLRAYDKTTSPKYVVVTNASPASLQRIERHVGYPVVVKPSGLTTSMFISVCYYREELEKALTRVIQSVQSPEILVEQFMEDGAYYSIDAYVGPRGAIQFTPPVYGKTGKDIGFDDFFLYMCITPSQLTPTQVKECERVAAVAIKALKIRSATCHIELMQTPKGWKIIELGPRIGGFRHEMYYKAFGINHALNDLLVRSGEKPVITKRPKGYSVAMKFFARQEGRLREIYGLDVVNALPSVERVQVFRHYDDICLFAKHGGTRVVEIVMFNTKRTDLLADIRKIEQNLEIETEPLAAKKKTANQKKLTTHGVL